MVASWHSQNPILRVHFAGWESDTYRLGYCGWEVAMKEDFHSGDMRVIMRHKELKLVAVGVISDFFRYAEAMVRGMPSHCPVVEMSALNAEGSLIISGDMGAYQGYKFVNTVPSISMMNLQQFLLKDIPIFQEIGKQSAQELIIEPQDVQFVLDGILKSQSSGMREIRERNAKREPETKLIHAQIISFKETA